jgi:hypothetical protein
LIQAAHGVVITINMTQDKAWLSFGQGGEDDLKSFLSGAPLDRPARIILAGEQWGPRACHIIAAAPTGTNLRVVFMRGAPLGDQGIEILANSTVLALTHSLGIERCGLTDRGVEVLAQSPHLTRLRELYLCNRDGIESGPLNQITDAGALALASANLTYLEKLDLWNTSVGDQGLEGLIASPNLPRLASVTAWGTRLTPEGARRFKALAAERWERRKDTTKGAAYCSIYTDYDERTIDS